MAGAERYSDNVLGLAALCSADKMSGCYWPCQNIVGDVVMFSMDMRWECSRAVDDHVEVRKMDTAHSTPSYTASKVQFYMSVNLPLCCRVPNISRTHKDC